MGVGYPHGLRVQVPAGYGSGLPFLEPEKKPVPMGSGLAGIWDTHKHWLVL
jgi:hypothetical protein